ncbi:MAG: hypothetical protein GFH27_549311n88 [Chloroflexi bacterium AL-W]|nr:hypothetical protein [Chloroflexi bacterium AL-N1]NOK68734.1 hypothetical protein [Chloroflexi bacterium AL-N10]NOK76220.1 hypothetical protein [Chloroflexi bacterium AL-N5]NOK84143.1 hypothetical protein [Chloroflexi bacterium AL-W]NOK91358.1 hypothetical protein [Chloroflexi bacterium AL-N15]
MRNESVEQQKVDQVTQNIKGAHLTLRTYGIDSSSRMSLAQAAAATSTPSDELLAVLEYRLRRQAKQARSVEEVVYEEEGSLVGA